MAKKRERLSPLDITGGEAFEQEARDVRRMGTAEEQLAFLRRFPGPYSVLAEAVVRKVQAGVPVSPDPLLTERSFPEMVEADLFLSTQTVEGETVYFNQEAATAEEQERIRKAFAEGGDV